MRFTLRIDCVEIPRSVTFKKMRLSYGPFKESHDLAKQCSVDLKVDDFVEQNIIVHNPCICCTVYVLYTAIFIPSMYQDFVLVMLTHSMYLHSMVYFVLDKIWVQYVGVKSISNQHQMRKV